MASDREKKNKNADNAIKNNSYKAIEKLLRSKSEKQQQKGLRQVRDLLARDAKLWLEGSTRLEDLGIRLSGCDYLAAQDDAVSALSRQIAEPGNSDFQHGLRFHMQTLVEWQAIEGAIKRLLLSPSDDDLNRGMVLVYEVYKEPILGRLRRSRSKPKGRPSPDFSKGQLPSRALCDVWQATMKNLWKHVWKGHFKYDRSLFAFLIKIARCRAIDWIRREERYRHGEDVEPPARDQVNGTIYLKEDFRDFYTALKEAERKTLQLDVDLFQENDWRWVDGETFATVFIERNAKAGGPPVEPETVLRRRSRVRGKFRDYIERKGNDV